MPRPKKSVTKRSQPTRQTSSRKKNKKNDASVEARSEDQQPMQLQAPTQSVASSSGFQQVMQVPNAPGGAAQGLTMQLQAPTQSVASSSGSQQVMQVPNAPGAAAQGLTMQLQAPTQSVASSSGSQQVMQVPNAPGAAAQGLEKTLPTYNFVGQIVTRSGINTAEASANNLQQQGLRIPQSVWGFKNPLTQQLAAKNKQTIGHQAENRAKHANQQPPLIAGIHANVNNRIARSDGMFGVAANADTCSSNASRQGQITSSANQSETIGAPNVSVQAKNVPVSNQNFSGFAGSVASNRNHIINQVGQSTVTAENSAEMLAPIEEHAFSNKPVSRTATSQFYNAAMQNQAWWPDTANKENFFVVDRSNLNIDKESGIVADSLNVYLNRDGQQSHGDCSEHMTVSATRAATTQIFNPDTHALNHENRKNYMANSSFKDYRQANSGHVASTSSGHNSRSMDGFSQNVGYYSQSNYRGYQNQAADEYSDGSALLYWGNNRSQGRQNQIILSLRRQVKDKNNRIIQLQIENSFLMKDKLRLEAALMRSGNHNQGADYN